MEDRNTCNTTPAGDWEKPESRDTLANNIPLHKKDWGIECIIAYSINLITAELLFFDMGPYSTSLGVLLSIRTSAALMVAWISYSGVMKSAFSQQHFSNPFKTVSSASLCLAQDIF